MDNLGWGLQITVLGMGLVFALLALLWGLLDLVLRFDRRRPTAVSGGTADGDARTASPRSPTTRSARRSRRCRRCTAWTPTWSRRSSSRR